MSKFAASSNASSKYSSKRSYVSRTPKKFGRKRAAPAAYVSDAQACTSDAQNAREGRMTESARSFAATMQSDMSAAAKLAAIKNHLSETLAWAATPEPLQRIAEAVSKLGQADLQFAVPVVASGRTSRSASASTARSYPASTGLPKSRTRWKTVLVSPIELKSKDYSDIEIFLHHEAAFHIGLQDQALAKKLGQEGFTKHIYDVIKAGQANGMPAHDNDVTLHAATSAAQLFA